MGARILMKSRSHGVKNQGTRSMKKYLKIHFQNQNHHYLPTRIPRNLLPKKQKNPFN